MLIPFDYKTALKKLDEIDRDLGKKFWEFYRNNYALHREFERGDVTEEYFINRMLQVLENKIDKSTFCNLYAKIFTENTELTSLLPVLRKNYKLVLLSNTNSIHTEYGWKDFSFLKNFDKIVLSHLVNAVKPEEKIYREVEKYTGRSPEEHLYIDDVEEYILAARGIGWDGILFTANKVLFAELRQRGIIF